MTATRDPFELPALPAKHNDFIQYLRQNPETRMQELLTPYKEYDNILRKVFAQQPDHSAIAEPNIVSLFGYVLTDMDHTGAS